MIIEVKNRDVLLALIIKSDFNKVGVSFVTSPAASQQVAFMKYSKDKDILPHYHIPVTRQIEDTQETLVIRKGKLRTDFYDHNQAYLRSYVLETGDLLLLMSGTHGFKVLEDLEMYEIKQGPYGGNGEKVRVEPVPDSEVLVAKF